MKFYCYLIFVLSIVFSSCNYSWGKLTINPGVHNVDGLNSGYDDYNITAPPMFKFDSNVIYSTNISSRGDKFDVWSGSIELSISDYDKGFSLKSTRNAPYSEFQNLPDSNEYGPMVIGDFYIFSSDRSGDLNIYCYSNTKKQLYSFFGNELSSDECYLTFHEENNCVYFSSNRDDNFDIYKCNYNIKMDDPSDDKFLQWFTDTSLISTIIKVDSLNSRKDDKFPYLFENKIFFSSDRDGGKGGFDIYYANFEENNLSSPINMRTVLDGEVKSKYTTYKSAEGRNENMINTTSNEYRPSVYNQNSFYRSEDPKNKILLFSSDRPDGKGGIDIYLAILPEDF